MKRKITFKLALSILLSCMVACNNLAAVTVQDEEVGKSNPNDEHSIDSKFVGSWKYLRSIPDDNPSDHSMDGIICELEKYKSTQKTYVFHLFTGNDLILSIKDDSTLTGENANMTVRYNEPSGHLILRMSSESKIIFSKLQ